MLLGHCVLRVVECDLVLLRQCPPRVLRSLLDEGDVAYNWLSQGEEALDALAVLHLLLLEAEDHGALVVGGLALLVDGDLSVRDCLAELHQLTVTGFC